MSFRTAMMTTAVTQNGDRTNPTSGSNPLLDVFSGITRPITTDVEQRLLRLMPQCWAYDPLATLKLIFYKRDIRGGAGERKIFEIMFRWLIENQVDAAIRNLEHVPFYGSYKDWTKLMDIPKIATLVAVLYANTLTKDIKSDITQPITLAAKWAPSLKSHYSKKAKADHKIAIELGFHHPRRWEQAYRSTLRILRDRLMIVEHFMSTGCWDKIDYTRVPSLAMQRYKKAFERHSPETWKAYRAALTAGEAKINSTVLMPHEIIGARQNLSDPVTIAQWTTLVDKMRAQGGLENTIAMCDVSGSMGSKLGKSDATAMDVSIALGVMISELSTTPAFRDMLISFTEQPRFFDLTNCTLETKVSKVRHEVGYNTDLAGAFRVILQRAMAMRVPESEMPKKIILISDMQFDQADRTYNIGTHEMVKRMYTDAGYQMPAVVYWNVCGALTTFPVTNNDYGFCMVSGFSQNILNSVLRGHIQDPVQVMMDTLNSERYDRIKLA